jgi:polar amino acid transport system substrate-binding protein
MKATAAVLVFLALVPFLSPAQDSVLLTTGEWEPYTSEKLKDGGFLTKLVVETFKKAGFKARVEFYPWKRAELMVRDGVAFGAFPYPINPYYADDFFQSGPLANNTIAFMCAVGGKPDPKDFQSWELADFKGMRVALLPGAPAEAKLREAGVTVVIGDSMERNIAMLLAGRLDFVVDDVLALKDAIEGGFPKDKDRLKFLDKPFNKVAVGLIVSKSMPNARSLLDSFDAALKAMKASGEYDRLMGEFRQF